ncbi:unnamed protein product [Echinostoma caproni]|uniref:Trematode PH-like domain-containing protein n=1 Tax=Echinostoma caproni TaxID=27848 RepID=A0A183A6P7_9TREM|nr:unnamed protein product [Echinostoma caproni]
MSLKRGRSAAVHGSWSSANTNESSQLQRRTQQLLYFECDVYTISRTLLRAFEDFSEERANMLFEKYSRKKVNRSVAHFLIDRISFQRKGAFGSKPFRKEVTYREIKYFFAWSVRPEYFMFCVADEKMRRKSYEIYRCDNTQDVHSICAFVYRATNDSQFILRNELPVDVISQSINEMDGSLLSIDDGVAGTISSQNESLEQMNWNNRSPDQVDRTNGSERGNYNRDKPPRPEPRYSKYAEEGISITRERPTSVHAPNLSRTAAPGANPYTSSESRAVDVYSFYDRSPRLQPRRAPSWGSLNNETMDKTITITRPGNSSSQRDFSAQSGVSLVTEATSPFLSTPISVRRATSPKKVDTFTSPFENTRHLFASPNTTVSFGSYRHGDVIRKEFDVRGKNYVFQESPGITPRKESDPTILYASSESFFDQPLSSDGPLYMYVTYVESDSQFGGSSTLSRASTRTGASRAMLDEETTDG